MRKLRSRGKLPWKGKVLKGGEGKVKKSVQEDTSLHSQKRYKTKFTDHQVRELQDFFEENAYPKNDDLEHLANVLGLTQRVIVVWFQNARQKVKKIYKNQHPPGNTRSVEKKAREKRPLDPQDGVEESLESYLLVEVEDEIRPEEETSPKPR